MGYASLSTIIEAARALTFADDGHTLLRTKGLWHVLIFLRHRRLHGLRDSYEFNSYDLSEACFDINGVYLPIEKDSRNAYYEPAASQGNTTSSLFRHREGPRQTFLNRFYTGLTGAGPNQPRLFTASSRSLPVTIKLVPEWINELRSHEGNKFILDARVQELVTWLFRFGIPNLNGQPSSIGIHTGSGNIESRAGVILEPIPDRDSEVIEAVADFLGLTLRQLTALCPFIKQVINQGAVNNFKETEPITFDSFKIEMEDNFAKEHEITAFDEDSSTQLNLLEAEIPPEYQITDDDEYFVRVQELLKDGFAGVIFTGAPGTSKSWYAYQVGMKLVNYDTNRIRFIQFHGSYQYEDFIEGFIPLEGGGFRLVPKHLMEMCDVAEKANGERCVLVIDELSRSDPARVFGEALTYIEMTKRDMPFRLASGKSFSIPRNLVFLATMNPMDKGVDEVDAALERRFAKIAMNPNVGLLRQGLEKTELDVDLQERIIRFFNHAQNKKEMYRIGHAYFYNVRDEASLRRLWENQLYFYFKKVFGLDEEGFQDIERHWQRIFAVPPSDAAEENTQNTTD